MAAEEMLGREGADVAVQVLRGAVAHSRSQIPHQGPLEIDRGR